VGLYANSLDEVICRTVNSTFNLPVPLATAKGITLHNVVDLGFGKMQGELNGARNSGWRGYKTVKWDKLNVGTLFTMVEPKIRVVTAATSLDLVSAISTQLGIPLTTADIVSHEVDLTPPGGGYPQCIVEIVDSHQWLTGYFIVTITSIKPDLDLAVVARDLETAFDYPVMQTNIAMTTYGYDYTEAGAYLKTLVAGTVLGPAAAIRLVEALRACDGRGWTSSTVPLLLNLYGATVVSNTLINPAAPAPSANAAYERCLVLRPAGDYWPNTTGLQDGFCLYLHYDDFGGQ